MGIDEGDLQKYRCILLLFLAFRVFAADPKKNTFYTVPNPARGLLNKEKRTKDKAWPTPLTHTTEETKTQGAYNTEDQNNR